MKGQLLTNLGCAGHSVSVVASQLCSSGTKSALDTASISGFGRVPGHFFIYQNRWLGLTRRLEFMTPAVVLFSSLPFLIMLLWVWEPPGLQQNQLWSFLGVQSRMDLRGAPCFRLEWRIHSNPAFSSTPSSFPQILICLCELGL